MSEVNKEFTFENEQYRKTYWHTCSHILAQAVKRLHPEVKLAIGLGKQKGADSCHSKGFGRMAENIQQFGRTVLEDIHPRDSWRASKAFRSHIAVESAKRAFIESVKLAGGEL